MMLPKLEKKYSVHSVFLTVQGEGHHAGRRAVFCRFTGCNVWNGNPESRERDAKNSQCALICDTEFRRSDETKGGGVFTARELSQRIAEIWNSKEQPFVVFTGGEPGLQVDEALVDYLHLTYGAYVAIESNGSLELPDNLDWVAISPKPPMPLVQERIDEVKLLSIFDPSAFTWNVQRAKYKWIQPVDFKDPQLNEFQIKGALRSVLEEPGDWRMGAQHHKIWGVE